MVVLQSLPRLLSHPEFRQGFRDESVLMPAMLAWGVVAGVAMVKAGLSSAMALLMSFAVYSAGAQLCAIAMMTAGAPVWVVVIAGFCVNLRFVIFSASLRPYLMPLSRAKRILLGYLTADLSYVVFMQRYGHELEPSPGQVPYLSGCCAANWTGWHLASVAGIVFADQIPSEWGLGFAGVLAMLGLCCTLLRDAASVLSAVVAFLVTIAARGLPLRLNIVLAIVSAILVGMLCDRLASPSREARP